MYSGETSTFSVAFGKKLVRDIDAPTAVGKIWKIQESDFQIAPIPSPVNTVLASAPPRSPATRTSAHAAPSGYGSTPCSLTISARRSGTIISTPRIPPAKASIAIWKQLKYAGPSGG